MYFPSILGSDESPNMSSFENDDDVDDVVDEQGGEGSEAESEVEVEGETKFDPWSTKFDVDPDTGKEVYLPYDRMYVDEAKVAQRIWDDVVADPDALKKCRKLFKAYRDDKLVNSPGLHPDYLRQIWWMEGTKRVVDFLLPDRNRKLMYHELEHEYEDATPDFDDAPDYDDGLRTFTITRGQYPRKAISYSYKIDGKTYYFRKLFYELARVAEEWLVTNAQIDE